MRVTCWAEAHPCEIHRRTPECEEPEYAGRVWPVVVAIVVAGALIGLWFSPRLAYGASPEYQSACTSAVEHPHGSQAEDCRDHGWTIRSTLAVDRKQVVHYSDLDSCVYEDGSGGAKPCSWNFAGSHDGNGIGAAYWTDRKDRTHYVWPADPTGSGWRWMSESEDHTYDAALHPKRWRRCVILETEKSTRVRCADGEHHRTD